MCKGITKEGKPCRNKADYCYLHPKDTEENIVVACLGRNKKCESNAIAGTMCQNCWNDLYNYTEENYSNSLKLVKSLFELAKNGPDNLLIKRASHLIQYWDFNKNTNIDIRTIAFRSNHSVDWKCLIGHETNEYLYNKTNQKNDCKICYENSRKVHEKEDVKKQRKLHTSKTISSTKIGDDAEEYIVDLLTNLNIYKKVEKIGHLSGAGDIQVTLSDDKIVFIQVKTMSKRKKRGKNENEVYGIHFVSKYPDNMLIIALNNDRTRFASTFWKDINVKTLTLSFTAKRSQYKHIMFREDTKVEFIDRLIQQIPFSSTENPLSENCRKEVECLERLESFCEKNSLSFKRNSTNGDTVDCFINNYRIQVKYCSFNEDSVDNINYSIPLKKSSGTLDGKKISKSYDEDDFDFLMVEVGGTRFMKDGILVDNPDFYKGNFFIISNIDLKEMGILNSEGKLGKSGICICPPDSKKSHWSKQYWNNISALQIQNP
jgi:hypothetical protein